MSHLEEPALEEKYPAGQFVHAAESAFEYFPAGHKVQVDDPLGEKVPSGHIEHEFEPGVAYFPSKHNVHEPAPFKEK